MHDIVIKNAVLVDGVGTPAFEGEIAVTSGKIAAVGDDGSVGEGRTTVDAEGLTLAPGIIDPAYAFRRAADVGSLRLSLQPA